MSFEVIDFHTHPFLKPNQQLGAFCEVTPIGVEEFAEDMARENVTHFCGSVIGGGVKGFDGMFDLNRDALALRKIYGDKYIPGFHVHPDYVEESCKEIDYAVENGVKLIGELVPYAHGWSDYSCPGFSEILDYLEGKDMVVSLHTMDQDQMEQMALAHKNITFVFAHPGEGAKVGKHIEIMKKCDNVYLDLSGTGLVRYGILRKFVKEVGAERILFGTDYPICNLKMYIAGVLGEKISDNDKELILSKNAKRLLKI
ncbi:MAG: amidohydrolase [Clostridia bacterium]|nr:amidohydrolase [Clostridia bacterium]